MNILCIYHFSIHNVVTVDRPLDNPIILKQLLEKKGLVIPLIVAEKFTESSIIYLLT